MPCTTCTLQTFHKVQHAVEVLGFAARLKQVRSGHCGEHTEVMRYCIESPKFETILGQCRTSVEMLWQHQDGIEVLCVCNEGKHQSVAVSAALQAIYEMEGVSSGGPHHLSNTWWRRLCSACSQCKANEDKDTLFRACVDTRLMVI